MIVKRGSKFRVVSEKGKNLGESESKEGAVKRLKQVEWFKHHKKCVVDPDIVKSNAGMQQYVPVVFQVRKPQDEEASKLDFPSSSKNLTLRDVKQPEFPSTPFTGEAYAQAFHNPRPSASVKDGTHVSVQGDTPAPQQAGPFRGEHGPDTQFKGSDYVPESVKKKYKKSIMIAGKKVIIKGSEGSDNEHFRNYPLDRGAPSREFDQDAERQKRKDWIDSEKMKEKTRAYDEAKRIHSYNPGKGPFELAQSDDAYLGRAKDSKPVGEYSKDYPGARVTFNQPIDPTKKPRKVFVHLSEKGREIKEARTKKSKGIMKLILQYTQNQPLAAGFKPLLAHLVKDDKEEEVDKALSTGDIARKIGPPKGQMSPSRARLLRRGAEEEKEQSDTARHDAEVGPHPDFGPTGGYRGNPSKVGKSQYKGYTAQEYFQNTGRNQQQQEADEEDEREQMEMDKGAFKDKWIKQQEKAGKDPLIPPGKTKKRTNPLSIREHTRRKEGSSGTGDPTEGWDPSEKSNRPNPIKGGKGDKLNYKDVDQTELAEGIKVEQEHVGKDPDKDDDEKRVAAADIAMDHLEEDEKYYTRLNEMEREAKEEKKQDTKKKKLLKLSKGKIVLPKGIQVPPGPPIWSNTSKVARDERKAEKEKTKKEDKE